MITEQDNEDGRLLEQELKTLLIKTPHGYRLTRDEIEATNKRVRAGRRKIPHCFPGMSANGITAADFIRYTRENGFSLINIAEDFALRLKQASDREARLQDLLRTEKEKTTR